MSSKWRIAVLAAVFLALLFVFSPDQGFHLLGRLLALGGITLLVAITVLALLGLWIHRISVRRMRQMGTPELEQLVWRYEAEYFAFIGHHSAEATAFKHLIESKDLAGLRREWGRLSSAFVRLEQAAGHDSRPLIMDYYCDHSEAIAELAKRDGA